MTSYDNNGEQEMDQTYQYKTNNLHDNTKKAIIKAITLIKIATKIIIILITVVTIVITV